MSALQELETRITGLRALIARRESQVGNAQHEGTFSDTSKHIAAARLELQDLSQDFIRLKCGGGGWDPVQVIERMNAPPPTPVQLAATDADVTARLRELLEHIPDDVTVGAFKQEFLGS